MRKDKYTVMVSLFYRLALVGALVFAGAPLAHAQSPGDDTGASKGVVNAVSYRPVPSGSAVMVRVMDNSDANLALKTDFETALKSQGFQISSDSPLVFTFETRDVVGAWSDSGRRSIIELEGRGGRMGGEDAKARVNIFNTERGGLLNKGEGETNIVTQGRFRLDLTLDDRTSRKRLWQGWAESDQGQHRGSDLLAAMVPIIVGTVGRTVRREAFKLP